MCGLYARSELLITIADTALFRLIVFVIVCCIFTNLKNSEDNYIVVDYHNRANNDNRSEVYCSVLFILYVCCLYITACTVVQPMDEVMVMGDFRPPTAAKPRNRFQ